MKKPMRPLIGAAALAAAGITLMPGSASAHTPVATESCEGLDVAMYNYPGPDNPNFLTVTIDGSVVLDTSFGEYYHQFLPWSASTSHEWTVVVDGLTDDGDATLTGTQEACTG